jgi:hypothetical protein
MACSQTELRTSGSIDLIRPPLSGPNSLSDMPAISQRVANETAQVLSEMERRFPIAP